MRGTPRGWRTYAVYAMAVLILGSTSYAVARTGFWMKPLPATQAAIKINYWVEGGGDPALISALKTTITAAGYIASATTDPANADLALSRTATPDATPVQLTATGTPAKLADTKIVTPTSTPGYYLTTHNRANLPAGKFTDLTTSLTTALKTAPAEFWNLIALGDIIIGRTVYLQMRRYGDPLRPFAPFADTIRGADLALADLECSISDARAIVTDGGMSFVSPFASAAGLKAAGIDAVNLSNNHSYNGGASGFTDTLDEMARLGVKTFGGGRNEAESRTPLIMTVKGIKVALLGYSSIVGTQPASATTPGMNYISMAPWGPFNESHVARMEADIKAAKQQADLVFVYYHWGTEYTHDANADQRTVAHRAIDSGADLILGTHPHWVQGIEWYKDRLITYSLGNFIFDQEWSTKTKQGTFLKATFTGKTLTSAEFVPYQIEDYLQPRRVSATTGSQILNDIFTHSWWPTPQPLTN